MARGIQTRDRSDAERFRGKLTFNALHCVSVPFLFPVLRSCIYFPIEYLLDPFTVPFLSFYFLSVFLFHLAIPLTAVCSVDLSGIFQSTHVPMDDMYWE